MQLAGELQRRTERPFVGMFNPLMRELHPKLGINESRWDEIRDYVQNNRSIRKEMKLKILKMVWQHLASGFGSYIAHQTCAVCCGKIDDREIEPVVEYHYKGDPYDFDSERYHYCIHCECEVYG